MVLLVLMRICRSGELYELIKVRGTASQFFGSQLLGALRLCQTLNHVRHEVLMLKDRGGGPFGGLRLCADVPPSWVLPNAWYDHCEFREYE
jgi:hypothetical protein